MAFWRHF